MGEIILYILLFIVCLSVLITIHELGHLVAAKIFKVYCFEFAVGMGPKIFSFKRKKGETKFSLRAIPFGGYVSMYGESGDLPFGVTIDENRSINKIHAWKRAIILLAGVFMNAVLALIIFFVANIAFPVTSVSASEFTVKEGSIADQVLKSDASINLYAYDEAPFNGNEQLFVVNYFEHIDEDTGETVGSFNGTIVYDNDTSANVAIMLKRNLLDLHDLSWSRYIVIKEVIDNKPGEDIKKFSGNIKSLTFSLGQFDEENPVTEFYISGKDFVYSVDETYLVPDLGLSFFKETKRNGFLKSLGLTFDNFGKSSLAIFDGLRALFTPKGIQQVGGIVSIGVQTTSLLKNFGVDTFLYAWGLISVNLAIMNLLPFPGLDGYQVLVLLVEKILHKEIPARVKSIISFVGIAILMVFMVLILIKDVIGLI